MPRCSVLLCKNDSRSVNVSNGGVSYHRFPKDPATKEKWAEATGRINWFPRPASTICSDHFDPKDVLLTKKGYKFIRESGVPTRNFLSYHVRTPTAEAKTKKKKHEIEISLPVNLVKVEGTPGTSRKHPSDSSTESLPPKSCRKAESDDDDEDIDDDEDDNDTADDNEETYQKMTTSEKELDSMLRYEQNKIRKQAIKMKTLQNKLKRLKMTISDMEDLFTVLEEKFNIAGEDIMCLRGTEVQVAELVARRHTNKELSEVVSKLTYSPELRCFALTLHYISAKAYNYVRKMFKTSLPHPRTLKHWYLKVDGDPGFTKEAFVALKRKADASRQPLLVTLAFDVMDVHRRVEVDGKIYGYVDMGTGLDMDLLDEARQVLAMAVIAINGHFKVPIAYFLTCVVTSIQRAELVKLAIEMAYDAGVKVVALSFDDCPENIYMTAHLGCNIEQGSITFDHPVNSESIVAIVTPSNLLKQLEDALRTHETLIDKDGCKIQWKFIKQLKKTLYLSNKLKDQFVDFRNARVSVKLAIQVFSAKTAEALQYCRKDLALEAYSGSEPTQKFVMLCNTLYDMINSTNSHVYGYRNALDRTNADQKFEYLTMASNYITKLKVNSTGGSVIRNMQKFNSFVFGIKTVYASLIETNILERIPLYKLSHDHLKLFFWNIKVDARCKIQYEPTPKKVVFAYKKIVAQIKANKGKNPPLEQIFMPLSPSPVDRINRIAGQDLAKEDNIEDDPELDSFIETLSYNKEVAVVQTAGHIVQQLIKKLNCDVCAEALVTKKRSINNFIIAKDINRLLYPSLDVVKICKTTEILLKGYDGKSTRQMVKNEVMLVKIMRQFVDSKIFDNISYHQVSEFPESNHVTDLMKAIVERYAFVHYKVKIKQETYKDILAQLKQRWMQTPLQTRGRQRSFFFQ